MLTTRLLFLYICGSFFVYDRYRCMWKNSSNAIYLAVYSYSFTHWRLLKSRLLFEMHFVVHAHHSKSTRKVQGFLRERKGWQPTKGRRHFCFLYICIKMFLQFYTNLFLYKSNRVHFHFPSVLCSAKLQFTFS